MTCSKRHEEMSAWISAPFQSRDVHSLEFAWLGQAGFIFKANNLLLGIDLYLSDSLAEKYRNSHFPHIRMMKIPIAPEKLEMLDVLGSTHGHTDHMDQGTITPLYSNEKQGPLFICPRAEVAKAVDRNVPLTRIATMNAGEAFSSSSVRKGAFSITALPSAHEQLDRDMYGNYLYLGYVLEIEGFRIYHSGDCVPYPQLENTLKQMEIEVALLPVNGRDVYRASHGVLGNFTIKEALELVDVAKIPLFVPHHFGMFDFNTVEIEDIVKSMSTTKRIEGETYLVPEVNMVYSLGRKG